MLSITPHDSIKGFWLYKLGTDYSFEYNSSPLSTLIQNVEPLEYLQIAKDHPEEARLEWLERQNPWDRAFMPLTFLMQENGQDFYVTGIDTDFAIFLRGEGVDANLAILRLSEYEKTPSVLLLKLNEDLRDWILSDRNKSKRHIANFFESCWNGASLKDADLLVDNEKLVEFINEWLQNVR